MANITLVLGTMKGGKSHLLSEQYLKLEKQYNLIALTAQDNHHGRVISSRSGLSIPASFVNEIDNVKGYNFVFIDELMLFNQEELLLLDQFITHADEKTNFFMAALNVDWMGNEFPIVTKYKAVAKEVIEIFPHCDVCDADHADHHLKISGSKESIEVDKDLYKTVCKPCWDKLQVFPE